MANPRVTLPGLAKLVRPKRQKGPEAVVVEQCVGFLQCHGWRAVRMSRGVATFGTRGTVTFGEPGMPDWLFIRYKRHQPAAAQAFWIEFKSPTDRRGCICRTKAPRKRCTVCDQQTWRINEEVRGGLVLRIESLEHLRKLDVWQ